MEGGAPSSKVCTFFKQGRCRFGDACRFAHPPGETEFSAPGDFPSLDDQGSAESSGSSRLGKWSKDEEMQEKGRAVEVRPLPPRYVHAGYPNQFYHLPPPPWAHACACRSRPVRMIRALRSKISKMCTRRCPPRQSRSPVCRARRGRPCRGTRLHRTTVCRRHRRGSLPRRRPPWRTYAHAPLTTPFCRLPR